MKKKTFLKEIAKHLRSNYKPSAVVKPIYDLLQSKLEGLTPKEADELSRIVAAFESTKRLEGEGKHLHVKKYPGATRAGVKPPWVDHGFMTKASDGQISYHSDPYHLFGPEITELAKLIHEGWQVSVNGRESSWFPGRTVRVTVDEPSQ